jgi:hypothetical protein
MTHRLVVTKPFLNFVRGDIIVDVAQTIAILASEHQTFVTKVVAPATSEG